MQLLSDKSKALAVLINCRLEDGRLMCGAAVFRGGLSGSIEVFDNHSKFKIEVPASVVATTNNQLFYDSKDNLEIKICSH